MPQTDIDVIPDAAPPAPDQAAPEPDARLLLVHPSDTVATATGPLPAGHAADLQGRRVVLGQDVPQGHKVALADHREGDAVVKYGFPIGRATQPIAAGSHVHSHNLATNLDGASELTYAPHRPTLPPPPPGSWTFEGYRRSDGRVGTRNEIWILVSVGCVNRAAERVAQTAHRLYGPDGEGWVDGVYAFAHPFGCSQLGDDLDYTQTLLAALARHPNAGGVLLMGLGCENNRLRALAQAAGRSDRLELLEAQAVEDEVEEGLARVARLAEQMKSDRRETVGAHHLTIGVKCGGSDGLSGLTANPLVGRVVDLLASMGGRIVQTEVPEMFGAESVLLDRSTDADVFASGADLIARFKRYFVDHGQPVYENPSPGNKDGGLTTLEEKSLGAVQKGGRAPVAQVIGYGEQAAPVGEVPAGLALVEAPGNDGVSSTALTAAGSTLVLFTTGRGTPLGFPAPTVKIATNDRLARRKPHWIDFSAGPIAAGADPDALALELLRYLLRVASGEPTCNERFDYREIAIWKHGVTL
jgi:altronate hydrolase